jgi:hypothetical protein
VRRERDNIRPKYILEDDINESDLRERISGGSNSGSCPNILTETLGFHYQAVNPPINLSSSRFDWGHAVA